jgi:hypothetical protein
VRLRTFGSPIPQELSEVWELDHEIEDVSVKHGFMASYAGVRRSFSSAHARIILLLVGEMAG